MAKTISQRGTTLPLGSSRNSGIDGLFSLKTSIPFFNGRVCSGSNRVTRIHDKPRDVRLLGGVRSSPGIGLVKKDLPGVRTYPIEKTATPGAPVKLLKVNLPTRSQGTSF